MKPTAAQLVAKIEEARGNISAVARAYNVARSTVYSRIHSYKTAEQALKDQRELVVDTAESVLFRKVVDGDMTAVAYVLNNAQEARERGWGVKRHDVTSGGEPIGIRVVYVDDDHEDA